MAEDEGVAYKGNTIREFERLRKQSRSLSEGRLHWTKDAELQELELEYQKLLKQKEALSKQVEEVSLLNKLQNYVKQHAEGEFVPLGDLASEDNLFEAIELIKKKKLMETYNTYRLTGLAFVLLENNRVRFCLDTFYKGQYFEPFYIEIQIKDEKIKILNHTVPFFIPLDKIVQKNKNSEDIKELLNIVSLYLKAFISRRQQCAQINEKNNEFSVENFYATPAFDFIKFTVKFTSDEIPDFDVKMEYGDLTDVLPKTVDLKCSSPGGQDLLAHFRANLLSSEIREAIAKLLLC